MGGAERLSSTNDNSVPLEGRPRIGYERAR